MKKKLKLTCGYFFNGMFISRFFLVFMCTLLPRKHPKNTSSKSTIQKKKNLLRLFGFPDSHGKEGNEEYVVEVVCKPNVWARPCWRITTGCYAVVMEEKHGMKMH